MFYLTTHSTHFIYGYMASDMVKDFVKPVVEHWLCREIMVTMDAGGTAMK